MFNKILVAIDGSEGSKKALTVAIALAAKLGAELHSISVIERSSHLVATVGEAMEEREETSKYFEKVIAEARAQAEQQGMELKCEIRTGHEVETIARYTHDFHFNLLVIGFMGHSRVFDRLWGGTSQNLAKTSPCSVLVVK